MQKTNNCGDMKGLFIAAAAGTGVLAAVGAAVVNNFEKHVTEKMQKLLEENRQEENRQELERAKNDDILRWEEEISKLGEKMGLFEDNILDRLDRISRDTGFRDKTISKSYSTLKTSSEGNFKKLNNKIDQQKNLQYQEAKERHERLLDAIHDAKHSLTGDISQIHKENEDIQDQIFLSKQEAKTAYENLHHAIHQTKDTFEKGITGIHNDYFRSKDSEWDDSSGSEASVDPDAEQDHGYFVKMARQTDPERTRRILRRGELRGQQARGRSPEAHSLSGARLRQPESPQKQDAERSLELRSLSEARPSEGKSPKEQDAERSSEPWSLSRARGGWQSIRRAGGRRGSLSLTRHRQPESELQQYRKGDEKRGGAEEHSVSGRNSR